MTSPEVPPKERISIGAWLALIMTVALVMLSMMVIVPPFAMILLPLAIGSAEMSPFLVLLDLLWCLPVNRLLRRDARLRWTSIVSLVVSACVAVVPLTQFNKVAAAASAQLGNDGGPTRFSLFTALRGLPRSSDVVERTMHYAAPDGTRLTLRLYALSERAVRPVVVVIYGGAWRGGDPTQGENVSKALASRGFAVAAIDYRHAPRAPFPAQLDDVNLSIGLLRDSSVSWGLDAERMAVLGRSSGGHLAELSAYAPNRYPLRAVVALYAPFDLVQGYLDLPRPDPIDARSVLRGFIGGTPDERPRAYRAASPSSYIMPGLPPTLLIFGGHDHIVKPAFNRGAAAALRAARVPVVSVEVPWAEHGFDLAPAGLGAQLAFGVIVDFLERELKRKITAPGA
ncbi:MAG: alpha/beta hydrolase [Gemmatimonadaceae bacterium]